MGYLSQNFVQPSLLDRHIVDLRFYAYVTGDSVTVGTLPFGRALPLSSHGKLNTSKGALQSVVFVHPNRALPPVYRPAVRFRP